MASTYTPLGVELQATGENAGTWGTKTNTNLQIIEQISGGYTTVNFGSDADVTLSVSDGSTGAALAHRVLEFTSSGSLTATRNCTIPLDVQQFYILKNSTTGSQSITFKYVSGSGNSVTVANGASVIAYAKADDGTNPNIVSISFGISDIVEDTTPQLGGNLDTNSHNIIIDDAHGILDENSNEQIVFQTTASAVNQIDVTNAATGNAPSITATGGDSNINLSLGAKGTGTVQITSNLDTNSQNIIIDDAHGINDENGNEQIIFQTTASAVNQIDVTNAATGNAPDIAATGGDTNIDLNLTPKGIGRATFNGQGKIQSVAEKVTSAATAATGTINYDVLTQAVLNFTSDASANWTLNIRGDGSNTLNSIMDSGESISIAHIVKNGSSAYYNNAVTIDGSSITPEYQGGSAPTAGNANSLDTYTYTIIKTGDAAFTVLAAQTQFA